MRIGALTCKSKKKLPIAIKPGMLIGKKRFIQDLTRDRKRNRYLLTSINYESKYYYFFSRYQLNSKFARSYT